MKRLAGIVFLFCFLPALHAQQTDRADTLEAAVHVDRNMGNYLSKGKEIRTEVVSSAGLMKMACCNLAESFENSASVTHWPIDSHRDHAVCGLLVLDAWKKLGRCFKLYYFEPMTGTQSQLFHPTDWVDISSVVEQKHKACDCHISQGIDYVMEKWHIPMERFRGLECRCTYAEAFIHHTVPGTIL